MDKLSIDSAKVLTTEEQVRVKEYLRGKAHIEAIPVKNDYVDDTHRGTVAFNKNMRNYAFHNVIIPDGSIISDCNFSQMIANTKAITGKNITFINCNLKNNILDESCKTQGCNTSQADVVIEEIIEAEAK